jgi:hypothetical protein
MTPKNKPKIAALEHKNSNFGTVRKYTIYYIID